VLTLNSGSSSLKFAWADLGKPTDDLWASPRVHAGAIQGIGGKGSFIPGRNGPQPRESRRPVKDHGAAVEWVLGELRGLHVQAVGHRIVHGGDRFKDPVTIDAAVVAEIERLTELAPLHNPSALEGIRAARSVLGEQVPMVALFDTAFHASMPEQAALYALPASLAARHGIRRYGFHGLAHASMVRQYGRQRGGGVAGARVITAHLGHGCSMAAIRDGRSIDTSMGFTPLEGLVMGTRAGDVDPSVIGYLAKREGLEIAEVDRLLNERSGLLGISGLSGDMKVLLPAVETGHAGAILALQLFCYRAKKYLGAYLAALGGADAIIFGGGIGERVPTVRAGMCTGMEWCGVRLDEDLNRAAIDLAPGTMAMISQADSPIAVFVAGVDEEWEMLQGTMRCLSGC
jgi:acetate kinase